MAALNSDQVKNFIFSDYASFILYAEGRFNKMRRQGVSPEEIVNEAIVSVFDSGIAFKSGDEVVSFVKKAILTVGWNERELLRDENFITKTSQIGKEYSLLERPIKSPCAPSAEFLKIYAIFEKARYGRGDRKKRCNKCGCKSFYNMANDFDYVRGGRIKCRVCGYKMSIQAQTYLHSAKIKYAQFYKLITLSVSKKKVSSREAAKRVGLSQKTTWMRMHLIKSTAQHIGSLSRSRILQRILVNSVHDLTPIKPADTNIHNRKLSPDDAINIYRLLKDKVFPALEIATMYELDLSQVYRIGRGEAYRMFTGASA